MNRRDFLVKAALAVGGFSILSSAKTYERIWKPQRIVDPTIPNKIGFYGSLEEGRLIIDETLMVGIVDCGNGRVEHGIWRKNNDGSIDITHNYNKNGPPKIHIPSSTFSRGIFNSSFS